MPYSMCPWIDFGNALVEKISEKTQIETKSGMKICHSKNRNQKQIEKRIEKLFSVKTRVAWAIYIIIF